MVMGEAVIGRILQHALDLALESRRLGVERGLEACERLEATRDRMVEMGIGELDGIAQKDDDPRLRQELEAAGGGQRMVQVVRAGLAAHGPAAACPAVREVRAIPAPAADKVVVEAVHFFAKRGRDRRVPGEVAEQRGGAGFLGAGDDESPATRAGAPSPAGR